MTESYFLDASYAIALVSARDKCHTQAVSLAQMLEQTGATLVTTRAVLLEIGNALAKQRYRSAAIQLLIALDRSQISDDGRPYVFETPQSFYILIFYICDLLFFLCHNCSQNYRFLT